MIKVVRDNGNWIVTHTDDRTVNYSGPYGILTNNGKTHPLGLDVGVIDGDINAVREAYSYRLDEWKEYVAKAVEAAITGVHFDLFLWHPKDGFVTVNRHLSALDVADFMKGKSTLTWDDVRRHSE